MGEEKEFLRRRLGWRIIGEPRTLRLRKIDHPLKGTRGRSSGKISLSTREYGGAGRGMDRRRAERERGKRCKRKGKVWLLVLGPARAVCSELSHPRRLTGEGEGVYEEADSRSSMTSWPVPAGSCPVTAPGYKQPVY